MHAASCRAKIVASKTDTGGLNRLTKRSRSVKGKRSLATTAPVEYSLTTRDSRRLFNEWIAAYRSGRLNGLYRWPMHFQVATWGWSGGALRAWHFHKRIHHRRADEPLRHATLIARRRTHHRGGGKRA